MTRVRELIKADLKSSLPMESVVTLLAEWFYLPGIDQVTGSLCDNI